jgi:hypothetical protein
VARQGKRERTERERERVEKREAATLRELL